MKLFILVNAVLYILLGLWCLLKPAETADYVGFTLNGSKGMAEYIAVYGGLEFAIGIICAYVYLNPELHRHGLFALNMLYACLALFRSYSIFRIGSDISKGWYFYSMELAFFIVASILTFSRVAK